MILDKAVRAPEPTQVAGSRTHLALAHLARASLSVVYAPMKLLPIQSKVVMISREHPEAPDDFLDLKASITRADPALKVVILSRVMRTGFWSKVGFSAHMVKKMYHAATARVLIVDTYSLVASVLNHKHDLKIIQIWHAVGALKKFGLSILGHEEGRDARLARVLRMHMGYDAVLVSSEAGRAHYAEALGTPTSRVQVAPLPRVDRIRDPQRTQDTRERIYARYPHLRGKRIAVYAPTFRLNGAIPVNGSELDTALEASGIHAIIKPHPLSPGPANLDNAPEFTTLEVLTIADIFITDYSTTVAEAALHGIPCYFLAPDLEIYLRSRGFYVDYNEEMPGPIVRSVPELIDAITAGAASAAKATAFAQRWVEVPGNPPPKAGSTPCADHITNMVLAATRTDADAPGDLSRPPKGRPQMGTSSRP